MKQEKDEETFLNQKQMFILNDGDRPTNQPVSIFNNKHVTYVFVCYKHLTYSDLNKILCDHGCIYSKYYEF